MTVNLTCKSWFMVSKFGSSIILPKWPLLLISLWNKNRLIIVKNFELSCSNFCNLKRKQLLTFWQNSIMSKHSENSSKNSWRLPRSPSIRIQKFSLSIKHIPEIFHPRFSGHSTVEAVKNYNPILTYVSILEYMLHKLWCPVCILIILGRCLSQITASISWWLEFTTLSWHGLVPVIGDPSPQINESTWWLRYIRNNVRVAGVKNNVGTYIARSSRLGRDKKNN